MRTYCKINTMFKRDTSREGRNRIIPGDWSTPELGYLADNGWVFTEKVDGTNIRLAWVNGSLRYGGRTDSAQIPAVIVNRLDELFRPDEGPSPLSDVFGNSSTVLLYGEGYGTKVQSGRAYTKNGAHEHDFVLFDVEVETGEGWLWLERANVVDIAAKLDIEVVPVIGVGTLHDAARLTSEGFKSNWNPELEAEGIVARPAVELLTRRGERMITKIKTRDYRDLRRLTGA